MTMDVNEEMKKFNEGFAYRSRVDADMLLCWSSQMSDIYNFMAKDRLFEAGHLLSSIQDDLNDMRKKLLNQTLDS